MRGNTAGVCVCYVCVCVCVQMLNAKARDLLSEQLAADAAP